MLLVGILKPDNLRSMGLSGQTSSSHFQSCGPNEGIPYENPPNVGTYYISDKRDLRGIGRITQSVIFISRSLDGRRDRVSKGAEYLHMPGETSDSKGVYDVLYHVLLFDKKQRDTPLIVLTTRDITKVLL